MSKVLVFGTFDVFHPGHDSFLRQAAIQGDEVYVVVARDANVLRLKGRLPQDSEEVRLRAVTSHPVVTNARLGYEEWGRHLEVLTDIAPDVICLGYDQKAKLPEGYRVVRMHSFFPEKYKSSLLRSS